MTKDVLVIGTGISGLAYAIHVADNNPGTSLVLISKSDLNEGNTRYAQGGIAVVSNFKKDSFDKHVSDTLNAGAGTCDPEVVKFVIEEGHERLTELMNWGAQFDKKETKLDLAKEAGHSENRIVHYKDQTGQHIQEALIEKIKTYPNIELLEQHTLVDLITDHHSIKKENRCYGAYVISQKEEKIIKITAKITVLSTGGAGSLFAHSTNPKIATGDGLGAAYRARVLMSDLPYVQFHPTALYPRVNGNTFLITEAVRGAGAQLFNSKGERSMLKNDPRAELAPRDIVARGIQREIEQQKDDFVWLNGSEIDMKQWETHFPTILETCKSLDIALPQDPIPVVPAAHYFCGGIKVNQKSESKLKGLYAIGECSATGLHGANKTGRPFTGDYAGLLLYETLYEFGFSSAAASLNNDQLELYDCRITNAVKCLPPQNKPLPLEIKNCNSFLNCEIINLPKKSIILALGTIAHIAVLNALGLKKTNYGFYKFIFKR